MNGDVYQADDIADSPLVANESNEIQKHVTIDGPSLITDKMSVFMVSLVYVKNIQRNFLTTVCILTISFNCIRYYLYRYLLMAMSGELSFSCWGVSVSLTQSY